MGGWVGLVVFKLLFTLHVALIFFLRSCYFNAFLFVNDDDNTNEKENNSEWS